MSERSDPGDLDRLRRALAAALPDGLRAGSLELLSQAADVADGTTVLLLRDARLAPLAVALCSARAAPDMVERAMDRARRAREVLGPGLGDAILEPLTAGRVEGLSFAVLPFCLRLSDWRPRWWLQRFLLRRPLLDWLAALTERTARDLEPARIDRAFGAPLRALAALGPASPGLRDAASAAVERLGAGAWRPRHVLMHGDLWKGNVLLRPASGRGQRFAIIDWPGSEVDGYAMFDLLRLGRSLGLGPAQWRREVQRHCRALSCSPDDAVPHLLAALGHLSMTLEQFPMESFLEMAEACYSTLLGVVGPAPRT